MNSNKLSLTMINEFNRIIIFKLLIADNLRHGERKKERKKEEKKKMEKERKKREK